MFDDVTCRRCGYNWTPKVAQPRQCPNCGSFGWPTPAKKKPVNDTWTYASPAAMANSLVADARFFARLVRTGRMSVEKARETIGLTDDDAVALSKYVAPNLLEATIRRRRETLEAFEKFLAGPAMRARRAYHYTAPRRRGPMSPGLAGVIRAALRSGATLKAVREQYHVANETLRKVQRGEL